MYFNSDQNINFNVSEFFSDDFFSDTDENNPLDDLPCVSLDKIADDSTSDSTISPSDGYTSPMNLPPDKLQRDTPITNASPPENNSDSSPIHPNELLNNVFQSNNNDLSCSKGAQFYPLNNCQTSLPLSPFYASCLPQNNQVLCPKDYSQMTNSFQCKGQILTQMPQQNAFVGYQVSTYGCCSCFLTVGTISTCNHITSVDQMKAYLQRKISGNSGVRFNKATLHYLYNIFASTFNWSPLSRNEKRKKQYVFKRLFDNKYQVIDLIQKYPSIIDQVLLVKGLSKIKNSNQ